MRNAEYGAPLPNRAIGPGHWFRLSVFGCGISLFGLRMSDFFNLRFRSGLRPSRRPLPNNLYIHMYECEMEKGEWKMEDRPLRPHASHRSASSSTTVPLPLTFALQGAEFG